MTVEVEDTSVGNAPDDTASRTLNITDVNDPRVASNDAYLADEDSILIISGASLLLNDTDEDGHTLSISFFTKPANGTLVDDQNGNYTYTPNANYTGLTSWTPTADLVGQSVTVSLQVTDDSGVVAKDNWLLHIADCTS